MSEPVSGSVGTPSQEGRPEMSQEAREDAWFGAYCEASALGGSGPRGRAVLMALADKEIAAALAAVVVSSPATPGRLDPLDPEPSCLVHFSGGPWHGQVIDVALTRVVAPVFAVGHPIGTHYWLDTKSDPPTYVWDGHPSPATPEVSRERDKPQVRELVARRLAQAEGKPFDLMSDWLRGVWLEEADSLLADIAASPATPNGQEEGAALLTHAWSGGRCRNCGCTETAPAATDPCISLAHPGDVDECPHGRHTHRYPGDCSCTCRFCRAAPSPASPAETREGREAAMDPLLSAPMARMAALDDKAEGNYACVNPDWLVALIDLATRLAAAAVSSSPATPEGGRCVECGHKPHGCFTAPSPASPAETREGREVGDVADVTWREFGEDVTKRGLWTGTGWAVGRLEWIHDATAMRVVDLLAAASPAAVPLPEETAEETP